MKKDPESTLKSEKNRPNCFLNPKLQRQNVFFPTGQINCGKCAIKYNALEVKNGSFTIQRQSMNYYKLKFTMIDLSYHQREFRKLIWKKKDEAKRPKWTETKSYKLSLIQ